MQRSKSVMLKKLRLSNNFPRDLLRTRKLALSLGLIKSPAIITVLVLQLFFGYIRRDDNADNIIKMNNENKGFLCRFNKIT